MDNCTYNKIKLLRELSKLDGFLQKYAKKDAKTAKHIKCARLIEQLQKDIKTHMNKLNTELIRKKF